MSKTYKKTISRSKYRRAISDPKRVVSRMGKRHDITILGRLYQTYAWACTHGAMLGDFFYVREGTLNSGYEYYRYRVRPQEAYTVDWGYHDGCGNTVGK